MQPEEVEGQLLSSKPCLLLLLQQIQVLIREILQLRVQPLKARKRKQHTVVATLAVARSEHLWIIAASGSRGSVNRLLTSMCCSVSSWRVCCTSLKWRSFRSSLACFLSCSLSLNRANRDAETTAAKVALLRRKRPHAGKGKR